MEETTNETLQNLASLEKPSQPKKNCFFVYLKLMLLPTLAYAYFVLGYLGILHVKVGLHSVILIGLVYFVALIFARHNGEFGACRFRKNSHAFEEELHTYINNNLMQIGNTVKSNASFDAFIDTYAKRIRNDNYASVAAGIFPTMGILGTFISIALTLPDFSSQNADALEKEIALLLSGVGTAFYVSIYGILLSLWWIFFEKRGLSRFDRDVDTLRKSTLALFWTKEEIEQAYLKENLQHFENIGKMFERLSSNDFFERLGKTIETKFDTFDDVLRLESIAVRKNAELFKEGMDSLYQAQDKHKGLIQVHDELLSKINQFNENTTVLHTKLTQVNQEILDANQEILQNLKENTSARSAEAPMPNEEVELLKESLKIIDAETEEIIQKMDALK